MFHVEQLINYFDFKFNDDELESEFYDFFYRNNLTPLFSNDHRTSNITVTYLDARSIVKGSGKYANMLKGFSDILMWATDNKSYEEAIFKMIDQARSFQGLMNTIDKIKTFIETDIDVKHLFNTWNIVWYNKDLY